eukprot:scaffold87345_cov37-Prasinocladus_malaysianus.AAC.2
MAWRCVVRCSPEESYSITSSLDPMDERAIAARICRHERHGQTAINYQEAGEFNQLPLPCSVHSISLYPNLCCSRPCLPECQLPAPSTATTQGHKFCELNRNRKLWEL